MVAFHSLLQLLFLPSTSIVKLMNGGRGWNVHLGDLGSADHSFP